MKQLTGMSSKEMVDEYNEISEKLELDTVKKFRDKATAMRRLSSHRDLLERKKKRKKEKVPAPNRPAKNKRGRKMQLCFAPALDGSREPREGTLAMMILDECFDQFKSIEDLEKVVNRFHEKKGNIGKLKCSTRYFTCRAISNLAKLNGYGFKQEIRDDVVYVMAYTS